ncbi:MAG: Rpn family recombination-promoting nuclease/putative transposase [Magnetococcales bacterium]|nr:Rpn family recombination-promoting nuclease/putative transposase [Magnetococcales bacterium]
MADIAHPHDRFLKALLSNPETAGTLLRERLPKEVGECLSPDPPELVDGTFVDEELRAHLTDRLFLAKTISGRVALLYCVIEHKSSPEQRIAWQLLRYMMRALEQWERGYPKWTLLPAIVPFVFYHGEQEWRIPGEFLDLVDAEDGWRPFLLNFRYTVMDLGKISDRDLSRQPRLRAWLLAAKYATRDGEQTEVKALLVEALGTVSLEEFRFLMRYMVETYESYDEQVLREIIRQVRPEEEEAMMSQFAQDVFSKGEARGRQEGLLAGEQKGRQEGRQEGEVAFFLRLLQRRFGAVPDWVQTKLASADLETLEIWSERVLDAGSLQEVFQ